MTDPLAARRALLRRPLTIVAGLSLGALALAAFPAVAAAHVHVHADEATAGSYSQLTFRVPTESDTAGTVKVVVRLPADQPLAYVSTKPVPGWTAQIVEATLPRPVERDGATVTKAASTITWTADDRAFAIAPGQYQDFSISAGPLAAGELVLPAIQTYSDGTVVAWDEPPSGTGAELEHPAPVLAVAPAAAGPGSTGATAVPAITPAPDWLARGLGGAGLLAGAVGLLLGLLALRRARPGVRG